MSCLTGARLGEARTATFDSSTPNWRPVGWYDPRFAVRRYELRSRAVDFALAGFLPGGKSAPSSNSQSTKAAAIGGCIYRATHNAFLAKEASRLHAILQPYRRMQLQVRNRMARSLAEHEAVVQAIRAGDDQAAADAMRNHVLIQGDRFHDLLAALRHERLGA